MKKCILKGLLFCGLFVPAIAFAGPVYVFTQPDGTIRFSTKKPSGVKAQVFSAKGAGAYSKMGGISYTSYHPSKNHKNYKPYIAVASARYGVSSDLISAVIHAESSFNPKAVSRKGALGLMQLMPFNARSMGMKNPFSPSENILAGTKFLSRLIAKFRGNERLALAAYNAGEGAVKKFGGVPPYPETRTYVNRVLALREQYRRVQYG